MRCWTLSCREGNPLKLPSCPFNRRAKLSCNVRRSYKDQLQIVEALSLQETQRIEDHLSSHCIRGSRRRPPVFSSDSL